MVTKILVVEDDKNIAEAEKMILETGGYEVDIAADGDEGLKKVPYFDPDLIILDLMMPKVDGVEVCKKLRADARNKDLKIVMVTAKDTEKDEMIGMEIGADDYICKPFEMDELLHVVKQVLNHK